MRVSRTGPKPSLLWMAIFGAGCAFVGPGAANNNQAKAKTKTAPKAAAPKDEAPPDPVDDGWPKAPLQARADVRDIMQRFAEGKFPAEQSPQLSTGWTMESRDGRRYYQTFLRNQATALVPYGAEAVPELVFWLDHEEQYMRYLARYSLGLITEVYPKFPFFETREQLRRDKVIDRAQEEYRAWYDAR